MSDILVVGHHGSLPSRIMILLTQFDDYVYKLLAMQKYRRAIPIKSHPYSRNNNVKGNYVLIKSGLFHTPIRWYYHNDGTNKCVRNILFILWKVPILVFSSLLEVQRHTGRKMSSQLICKSTFFVSIHAIIHIFMRI